MSLEFRQLTKKYGDFYALKDFSVVLDRGIYALLGPNGAGKSTLMNLLAGISVPTNGDILYDGTEIREMGEEFREILGFMPQYPGFYPGFTAMEMMLYLGQMKGLTRKQAAERGKELLEGVNLSEVANKKIGAFSGGMKQRLGLAQALINDPKVLILDEPTAGLDPKERIRFRNLISKLARNKTVIFCTHIVSDIETIAKEVLLLHHGVLLEKRTIPELATALDGKVWEVASGDAETEELLDAFPCSCLVNKDGRLCVRIVSEEKPREYAVSCKATLEDVYLFRFGDREE